MKKTFSLALVISLVMCLACCTSTKTAWNELKPSEQSVIIISGLQTQLDTLFTVGKDYVSRHPEKQEIWKTKVVPAFDTTNKTILAYAILVGKGETTPDAIANAIVPLVQSIAKLLKAIGVENSLIENITGGK